ncbi:MAG: nucleotidyltransferase [Candidatus Methylomirabilia bacterium]
MGAFIAGSAKTQLDQLLEEVCIALQLSPAQYRDAEEKYVAVGAWLADAGSPLACLNPVIYPQGSTALQTTVKPRDHDEFDLDLVLQVEPISQSPMTLYEQVYRRLKEHKVYADKIERLKRCIRLNYAKQFHLERGNTWRR